MAQIGLWQVSQAGPIKINQSSLGLERNLEDWIESNPDLLQKGLTIIGRQIYVEGGPLDLLALDPQGQWIVIELKSGTVSRDTIAQVLDYASCIATLPYAQLAEKVDVYLSRQNQSLKALMEQRSLDLDDQSDHREVIMYVVGTSRQPGLERMVDFLASAYQMPINVVTFEVFELESGERILLRELTEADLAPVERETRKRVSLDDVLNLADRKGTGSDFRKVLAAAQRHGLYPRLWPTSLMYTSPSNRTRTLFTVWAEPKNENQLYAYICSEVFAEFYPVDEQTAFSILGDTGYRSMNPEEVDQFIEDLDRLFEKINSPGGLA